jgi:hypothetical protein
MPIACGECCVPHTDLVGVAHGDRFQIIIGIDFNVSNAYPLIDPEQLSVQGTSVGEPHPDQPAAGYHLGIGNDNPLAVDNETRPAPQVRQYLHDPGERGSLDFRHIPLLGLLGIGVGPLTRGNPRDGGYRVGRIRGGRG